MSRELNAENRNVRSVRCCSFCRSAGHNITRCDSEPIRIFEREIRECINIIMTLAPESSLDLNLDLWLLKQYLLNKAASDTHLVRGFAISRCGASIGTDAVSCVQLIIQYFMVPEQIIERATRIMNQNAQEKTLNRKFHIKTEILTNQYNMEEKCECTICYDEHEKNKFIKLGCGHEFCKDCVKKSLQNEERETPCCAFCRSDIKKLELKLESIKDELDELITSEF